MNYLEFLQGFRDLVEQCPNWNKMSQFQKTAIMKVAEIVWRIMSGTVNHWGAWFDMEKFTKSVKEEIQEETK